MYTFGQEQVAAVVQTQVVQVAQVRRDTM